MDEILKQANIGGGGWDRNEEGELIRVETDASNLTVKDDDMGNEDKLDYVNQQRNQMDASREEQEKNYEIKKKYYNIAETLVLKYEGKDPSLLKRFATFLNKFDEAMKNEIINSQVDVLDIDMGKLIKNMISPGSVYQEFLEDIEDVRNRYDINELHLIDALKDILKSQNENFQNPNTQESGD